MTIGFFSTVSLAGDISVNYLTMRYPSQWFWWSNNDLPATPQGTIEDYAKELGMWCSIPESDLDYLKKVLSVYVPMQYESQIKICESSTVQETMNNILFLDSMKESIEKWEVKYYNDAVSGSLENMISKDKNCYKALMEIIKEYYKYQDLKKASGLPIEFISQVIGYDQFRKKAAGNAAPSQYLSDCMLYLDDKNIGKSIAECTIDLGGFKITPQQIMKQMTDIFLDQLVQDTRDYIELNVEDGKTLLDTMDLTTSASQIIIAAVSSHPIAGTVLATIELENKAIDVFHDNVTDSDNYATIVYDILKKGRDNMEILKAIDVRSNSRGFGEDGTISYDLYKKTWGQDAGSQDGDYLPYPILRQNIYAYNLNDKVSTPVLGYIWKYWASDNGGLIGDVQKNRMAITKNVQIADTVSKMDVQDAKEELINFVKGLYQCYKNGGQIPSNTYALNITSTDGTVIKSPEKTSYEQSEQVTLTAIPSLGYRFTGWSGDISGTNLSVTVTVNSDMNIIANYEKITSGDTDIIFADVNLKNELLKLGIDTNNNGEISVNEANRRNGMLMLNKKGISNISGIKYFTNVSAIYLDSNNITDISEIGYLTNLAALGLNDNNISNISVLRNLPKLTHLNIQGNNIKNFDVLKHMTQLEILTLYNCNIENISGVENLVKLKTLFIGYNNINDLTPLSNMKNLVWLDLRDSKINNIDSLTGLTNLTELSLQNNEISSIGGLDNLSNLKYLYLNNNRIGDISPISKLNRLIELNLSSNPINNVNTPQAFHQEALDFTVNNIRYEVWVVDTSREYKLNVVSLRGIINSSLPKETYKYGEEVTLTASPTIGYRFVNWSGDASGTGPSITIKVIRDMNITANYEKLSYSLNVLTDHGKVSNSPNKVRYDHGEEVRLTASPSEGYNFVNWSGDAGGTSLGITITMDRDKIIKANYREKPITTYTLSVTSNHGSISKNPDKAKYEIGEEVTLTAIADVGYEFVGWNGDVSGAHSNVVLKMNGNKNVIANFEKVAIPVKVSSINIKASTFLKAGEAERLTAEILPANAANKSVDWSVVRGRNVATVSSNGLVKALSPGIAVIRAASPEDSTKYDECLVTVEAELEQTNPILTRLILSGSIPADFNVGDTFDLDELSLIGKDQNAAEYDISKQTVTWQTVDPDIASVTTGSMITLIGVNEGTTSLKANIGDVESNTMNISVGKEQTNPVLTSLILSGSMPAGLNIGDTFDLDGLNLIGKDQNAAEYDISKEMVNWLIGDPHIISILDDTLIAKSQGTTTLRAYINGIESNVINVIVGKQVRLNSLVIKDASNRNITIYPEFSSNITNYSATVNHSISNIIVTAAAESIDSVIRINGDMLESQSISLPISVGENSIDILITNVNHSSTKNYVITLTRRTKSNTTGSNSSISDNASNDGKKSNLEIKASDIKTEGDSKINDALIRNNEAVINVEGEPEDKVELSPNVISALIKADKKLAIKNEDVSIIFAPQSLEIQELKTALSDSSAKIELGAKAVDAIEQAQIMAQAQIGESTGLFSIGGKIFNLTAQVVSGTTIDEIDSFNEPVAVTIDLFDLNLTDEDISSLIGVRYEKTDDGSIVPVKLGGTYDQVRKSFTFYTEKFSLYGVLKTNSLINIELIINNNLINVNGSYQNIDVPPTIVNNRTMVPLRFIGEALKVNFTWNKVTKTVSFWRNNKEVILKIGQLATGVDTTAIIINGRIMVPVRYISECFGVDVQWIADKNKVIIVK
jgi:hypothetical protein